MEVRHEWFGDSATFDFLEKHGHMEKAGGSCSGGGSSSSSGTGGSGGGGSNSSLKEVLKALSRTKAPLVVHR